MKNSLLSQAGIEVNELMERVMHNEKLVNILIKKFLEDQTYNNLIAAIQSDDQKKAEYESHTLKGVCGNMGLKKLYNLFSEQVLLIRNNEFTKACDLMEKISVEYETALIYMKQWLAE